MDLQKLNNLKHWMEYSSFTFSLEKYVVLTNSLILLQSENHFKKILFWGVIQGLEADYYIAFGYEKDALSERKYFYSEDCQNWKLLPVPQPDHLALTELCKRPFQGDIGFVVEVVDDSPPDDLFPEENPSVLEETEVGSTIPPDAEEQSEKNLEGEEEKEQASAKTSKTSKTSEQRSGEEQGSKKSEHSGALTSGELKEEDRLAAIIHIITEEAAITPRGGIYKQTDGVNVHSRAFEGIKIEDADSLCSFQHYRVPHNDVNTNLLIRCDYNYAMDFLDTIDKDIPADCWSAQLVEGDRAIVLRSLHWPGFMFLHVLDSPFHGFLYVGNGQRNLDIPFMTQVMIPVKQSEEGSLREEGEGGSRLTATEGSRVSGMEGSTSSAMEDRNRPSYVSGGSRRSTSRLDSKLKSKLGTKLDTKIGSAPPEIPEEDEDQPDIEEDA